MYLLTGEKVGTYIKTATHFVTFIESVYLDFDIIVIIKSTIPSFMLNVKAAFDFYLSASCLSAAHKGGL